MGVTNHSAARYAPDGIISAERPYRLVSPNGRALSFPLLPASPKRAASGRKPAPADTLIILPSMHVQNSAQIGEIADAHPEILELLKVNADAGAWIATCANGLVFPALLGLLDGAVVNVPWASQRWFNANFPRCDFSADGPMNTHGRVFTCAAPALQTEFILNVLGNLMSTDLVHSCASLLLHQPKRQQITTELVTENWLTKTSDSPVYRATQWLQANLARPYQMAALAQAAAVSERTLLRHFKEVLKMMPLAYLHDLRIERAKVLLEVTLQDAHAIATACGYQDAASFRRLFKRATGMLPTEHRARFALRSPQRKNWKASHEKSRK